MDRFANLVVEHKLSTVVGIILVALICGYLAFENARINSDLSTLIEPSDELKWHQDNEYFKAKFPMFEQTAVVVVSGERYGAVKASARKLVEQFQGNKNFVEMFAPSVDPYLSDRRWYFMSSEQLTDWLRGVEYSFGPALRLADEASVTNFLFTLSDHLSSNRGQPLPPPLDNLVSSIGTGYVTAELMPDLSDPDALTHYELIIIRGQQDLGAELPNELIVEAIRQDLSQVSLPVGVDVHLTGEVVLAHEEIGAALDGIELAGLISMVLLAAILGVGIRSLGFILAVFAMLAVGLCFTLLLAVLVVGSFNTLSLIFVVMFFGLGVDFAVHFGLRLREAVSASDFNHGLASTYRDLGPALLLCMLTSSIAFLSFTPTAYNGLAELGLISALGMLVAFLLSMTLLPGILSFVDLSSKSSARNFSFGSKLSPARVLLGFTLLIVLAAGYAKDLEFDYSVLAMRDSDSEGMKTLLELQKSGVSTDYSISVLAMDEKEADLLTQRLKLLPEVSGVLGPGQLIPRDQERKYELAQQELLRFVSIETVYSAESAEPEDLAMALDYLRDSLEFAKPEDEQAIGKLISRLDSLSQAQIEMLNKDIYEGVSDSIDQLRESLSAAPFTQDDIPDSLRSRFITHQDEYLLLVQPEGDLADRDATTLFIEAVNKVAPNVAGRSVVEWGVGNVVVDAYLTASLIALSGIFLVLVLFFRGVLLPILVLVPICVSLLFTFAICHLTGLTLNMANILVVPLIIGLGVDTGIHVVHRMKQSGVDELANSSTSQAVLISALTTVGTFFSLSFSPHLGAASIGLLLTVAISILVVVTFVLLPALMKIFGLDQK